MIISEGVVIALIVTLGTVVNALIGLAAIRLNRSTHELVNGMSHELRDAQVGQASADGFTLGEAAQRGRTADRAKEERDD